MPSGLTSLDEAGIFLRAGSLEINTSLEVSGKERSRRVIKETLEGAKDK